MKYYLSAVLLVLLLFLTSVERASTIGTDLEAPKEFKVYISVNYTPPTTFDRPAPYYRAASPLSLTCVIDGVSDEGVFYEWRSTCTGNCFAARQTTKTVSTQYLHSYDSSMHTCIVYDGLGCSGNASVTINVVGAGIYVTSGQKALPNNDLIIADAYNRISEFRCLSGSSSSEVGQLLSPAGKDITFDDSDHFLVRRGGTYDPGLVHVRRIVPLSNEEQGVYTCRIPDETGTAIDVNVGLYLNESAVAPAIEDLEYGLSNEGLYTITCTTFGTPPTSVTWTKNGVVISTNNSMYQFTQVLVDRNDTIYENLLTIKEMFEDAIGDYSCTAKNSLGASETVNRTIKAMEISGHETPVIVGLSGNINCSTHLNVSKLEWYIKGFDDPVESATGVSSLLLTLNPEGTSLNGTSVICKATVASGKVYEETVVIMVKELENTVRIEGPRNPLLAGGSYSFTCTVTADLLPEVKWRDGDGNDIQYEDVEESENGVYINKKVVTRHTTSLILRFRSLLTSQGGSYTCLSIIRDPSSIQVGTRDVIVKIPPPLVRIVHRPSDIQLFTTDNLDLVCLSNIILSVDVPVQVNVSWSGPMGGAIQTDGRITILGVEGAMLEHDSTLRFSSLRSSDSGNYTCISTATPTQTSRYIITSSSASTVTSISAALKTSITISYTPPDQYPDYAPPNYRAATSVTLSCSAEGASGSVSYRWSSTCNSCFASSSSSSSISETMLRSRDNGVHTCTATDSIGNTGSNSTIMNIVGAGVYVTRSISYAGRQAAQPNNTYVVVDTGSQQHSDYIRLKLYCCSNTTSNNVGSFTFPNGVARMSNYNYFRITRFSSSDANAGCIYMDIYYFQQRDHCYYQYDYWYGSRRVCDRVVDDNFIMESSRIGVYTCNIPDVSGNMQRVQFAMYSEGSHSISVQGLQKTASTIAPTLLCSTSRVPPTEVSWQKNGYNLEMGGNNAEMIKSVTNRYSSSYSTSLLLYTNIENVKGNYTCMAGNRYGNSTSQSLNVRGIETNLTSNNLVVGQYEKFYCSSDLDPQTVTWYRNGTVIASVSGSYKDIIIDPISTDHHGMMYSCAVVSPYGSQQRNKTLRVTVPDEWATVSIIVPRQDPLHGYNYTIECNVHIIEGINIPPVILWYHPNGSVIESGHHTIIVDGPRSTNSRVQTTLLKFSPVLSDDGGAYTCRAQVTVPWMTDQPATHNASVNMVVTTQVKFQLRMGPLPHCSTWEVSTAQALQRSIKTEIEEAVQHRCDCDFYSSAIYSGEFSCQTTTSDVIYRAIINGTSDLHTAAELLDYIENWRKTDQTLLHNLFRLRLSQDCPIKISSFNEIECTGTDIGNNKMNTNLRCDKFGGNSDNRNLLLGSGTCYRFEACNGDSDVYGDGEYSGQSGGYYNGSGGNRIESGESSTAASGEDSSSGDDDYFGGITYS